MKINISTKELTSFINHSIRLVVKEIVEKHVRYEIKLNNKFIEIVKIQAEKDLEKFYQNEMKLKKENNENV